MPPISFRLSGTQEAIMRRPVNKIKLYFMGYVFLSDGIRCNMVASIL